MSTEEQEMLLELYKELYGKLVRMASVKDITEADLQRYFIPDAVKFSQSYFFRLASSLQNSWSMGNTVHFHDTNREVVGRVLFDFDASKTVESYGDAQSLYRTFLDAGIQDKGSGTRRETNWMKFSKGLMDGARFLSQQGGSDELYRLIHLDDMTFSFDDAFADIEAIYKKIHGLGFALTCDWLKECGCQWLAKPDLHIIEIIRSIKNDPSYSETEIMVYIFNWAKAVRVAGIDETATAYKLDKILWLICTGNFYLNRKESNRDMICRRAKEIRENGYSKNLE